MLTGGAGKNLDALSLMGCKRFELHQKSSDIHVNLSAWSQLTLSTLSRVERRPPVITWAAFWACYKVGHKCRQAKVFMYVSFYRIWSSQHWDQTWCDPNPSKHQHIGDPMGKTIGESKYQTGKYFLNGWRARYHWSWEPEAFPDRPLKKHLQHRMYAAQWWQRVEV